MHLSPHRMEQGQNISQIDRSLITVDSNIQRTEATLSSYRSSFPSENMYNPVQSVVKKPICQQSPRQSSQNLSISILEKAECLLDANYWSYQLTLKSRVTSKCENVFLTRQDLEMYSHLKTLSLVSGLINLYFAAVSFLSC